jgi:hypothetical protein
MKRKLDLLAGLVGVLTALAVIAGSATFYAYHSKNVEAELLTSTPTPNTSSQPVTPSPSSSAKSTKASALPTATVTPATPSSAVSLSMAFTTQAPTGNWDAIHEDACEEASLYMVELFRKGTHQISSAEAEQEIQRLVALGQGMEQGPSITLTQLAELAKQAYGLATGRIEHTVTKEALRKELAAGKPIIIPAAGRELHNPHYSGEGPVYHMLVVRGYDPVQDEFITSDPGTRFGDGYQYGSDTFLAAIHDYNATAIDDGQPAYLVFD